METGPPDRTLKLFPPPLLQLCGLVGKRISSMHQQKKKGGGGGRQSKYGSPTSHSKTALRFKCFHEKRERKKTPFDFRFIIRTNV